ncbi:LytTR family DNA-binding domain-containing protein [Streptococcus pantholopis]|uniref:Transcriptional regulator n=1 Tax=Streptococcus pantholopis TaxID=1811193 RepID=A0A172Q8W1_9STRE|nr:LytTR family DNA-binding domain-containing protein [Streptococcus pantholopis]AND79919.1 transcriptional regulator [Streptococcus pantholopis]
MDYRFEKDDSLRPGAVEVLVRSQELTADVQGILAYLSRYDSKPPVILPLKTNDRLEMLKVDELVFVDVDADSLILETLKGRYIITERLYKFKERLNNPDFIQVSKHGLININHLQALEASFSGNMLAILTGKRKADVSRRYLRHLENALGL